MSEMTLSSRHRIITFINVMRYSSKVYQIESQIPILMGNRISSELTPCKAEIFELNFYQLEVVSR